MTISQCRLATDISVSPRRINEIVHDKRGITADTALRLGHYFGTTPQLWMNPRARFELETEADRIGTKISAIVVPRKDRCKCG